MLQNILDGIKLYPKIKEFVRSRYIKTPNGILVPVRAGHKEGVFVKYDIARILGDMVVVSVIIALAGTVLRYWALYNFLTISDNVYPHEISFLLKAEPLLSNEAVIIIVEMATFSCIISYYCLIKGWIQREYFASVLLVGVLLVWVNLYAGVQVKVAEAAAYHAYAVAMRHFDDEEYEQSGVLFEALAEKSPLPEMREHALGRLAGAHYWEGRFREAVEESCRFIALYPDSEIYEAQVTTLHWAIYSLGKSEGYDSAEKVLREVAPRYGYLCRKEASPFWLGISPRKRGSSYSEEGRTESRYQYPIDAEDEDKEWLRRFARKYPEEKEAEYALFIVGDYDRLINNYPRSELISLAYFRRASEAYQLGRPDDAIKDYTTLANSDPNSDLLPATYSALGQIYEERGDYYRALDFYFQRKKLYEATYGFPSLHDPDIMYILDVILDIDEIEAYIETRSKALSDQLDILEYSIAEKLFARKDWSAAKAKFEAIKAKYPASLTIDLCNNNIALIAKIENILQQSESDALFDFANLLLSDEYPIFYNDLWNGNRAPYIINTKPGITMQYFERNNDDIIAVGMLEELISNYPQYPRLTDAVYMQGQVYERLGNWSAFLPHQGKREMSETSRIYRDLAAKSYLRVVEIAPAGHLADKALEKLAGLYLTVPYDFERARAVLRQVVDSYPQHHLANNALNWIAWTFSVEANFYPTDSPEYLSKYQDALMVYEEIIHRYPDGHVAESARQNIVLIGEKLVNPKMRANPPSIPVEVEENLVPARLTR